MRDHELYATILGLTAPWTVERSSSTCPGAPCMCGCSAPQTRRRGVPSVTPRSRSRRHPGSAKLHLCLAHAWWRRRCLWSSRCLAVAPLASEEGRGHGAARDGLRERWTLDRQAGR